ncbi:MAG: YceI family protein [Planctomycetota bacterium]|nr:YceI family protein [Planctomycetota bacterium]
MLKQALILATLLTLGLGAMALSTVQDAPAPSESTAKSFKVDPVHSTAIFRVHHRGAGRFYGRFNDVTGLIEYTPGSEHGLSLDISIDINSVDTGTEQLDNHLKSLDFFNAVEFPAMTFKSNEATLIKPGFYRVKGIIRMHGVSHPLTIEVEETGLASGRRGELVGFETTFTLKRSQFDMNYGVEQGALGDDVRVIVSLEAIAQ